MMKKAASIVAINAPSIKGRSVFDLPAKGVAGHYFKGGMGQDDNPYAHGTDQREEYMWEMHRLQELELRALNLEIRGKA